MKRKRMCKQPTCGCKTLHTLKLDAEGLRMVWECGNCWHQIKPKLVSLKDASKAGGAK